MARTLAGLRRPARVETLPGLPVFFYGRGGR
jgi:hypothetical protein